MSGDRRDRPDPVEHLCSPVQSSDWESERIWSELERAELGEQRQQNALIARIRAEYEELPGLRLTLAQARRLWQIDHATCAALFEQLVADGFLRRSVTREDASASYAVR